MAADSQKRGTFSRRANIQQILQMSSGFLLSLGVEIGIFGYLSIDIVRTAKKWLKMEDSPQVQATIPLLNLGSPNVKKPNDVRFCFFGGRKWGSTPWTCFFCLRKNGEKSQRSCSSIARLLTRLEGANLDVINKPYVCWEESMNQWCLDLNC